MFLKKLPSLKFQCYKLFPVFLLLLFGGKEISAKTDKYRISWRDDPSTTMVIGWNQVSGNAPVLYYGTEDQGTNHQAYPLSKAPDRNVNYKSLNHHFARLSGLKPNTAYYFVIRDSEGTSKRFWFKTAPDDPNERLSLIAGGDSRNNAVPRRNANLMVAKLRPHAVLFGGDMTDKSTDAEWIEWLDDWQLTTGTDGRMIPIIAERGNHDRNSDMVEIFDVPNPNVYYALSLGGPLLRVYTLNSEITVGGDQARWLESDLEANNYHRWKIAQYHRPMKPHTTRKVDRNDIIRSWEPLFYKYGVKLSVESDAHLVKSTYPIRASDEPGSDQGFIRDDDRGVTYIGEGCWGAPLRRPDHNKSWTRDSDRFNHFTWIFVEQDKIEVRYVRIDNAEEVGTVNDSNVFALPVNIDIWSPRNGPVITVYPNPENGGNSGVSKDITEGVAISTGNDDVEENQHGGMYMNSSDLELVNDGNTRGDQIIGLRFNDLSIPKGAFIKKAYIQFYTNEVGTRETILSINGEANDDAREFVNSDFNVSSRTKTSATVGWIPTGWSDIGVAESVARTPDLKEIVQEIVDRPGWDSLNSMAFIITGTGKRTAYAYEGNPEKAARLIIEYSLEEEIPTSIEDKETDVDLVFKCYPNPAQSYLNVELDPQLEGGAIEMFDITGKNYRLPMSYQSNRNVVINTGGLNSGIYFLTVKTGSKVATKRIIIK